MKHPYKPCNDPYMIPASPIRLMPCYQCGTKIECSRAHFYIGDCPIGGEHGKEVYGRCDVCEMKGCAEKWHVLSERWSVAPIASLAILGILGALERDPLGVSLWVLLWVGVPCICIAALCKLVARNFERKAKRYGIR